MSDGHDHDAHEGAAHAHDDHGFDGEPAKELAPDEPMTPGWLPAVGGALFVGLALFGLYVSHDGADAKTNAPPTTNAPAQQTAAQPAQPLPSTMRPQRLPDLQPAQPAQGAQTAPGSPQIKRMTPDELKEVQRRLNEMQKQKKEGQ